MLEVIGLEKTFKNGKHSVKPLNGAEMYIRGGEKVGVIGKSGEGKSTLARIIKGFIRPDGGNVICGDTPLFNEKGGYDKKRGIKIQLIPQHPLSALDPSQRVGNAVAETLLINRVCKTRREAAQKTKELFKRVWLEDGLRDRLPSQLSGGQAQRVAVARALAVSPDILISDEATAMLDISSQAQIISLFNDLVEKEGLSVLFISHDESLTKAFVNRCYRLADGKLYENIGGFNEKEKQNT